MDIWKQRLSSLRDEINNQKSLLSQRAIPTGQDPLDSGEYRAKKINATIQVLDCLFEFSGKYIRYFENNLFCFTDEKRKYSREYIFNSIFVQIGNDLDLLLRIANEQFQTDDKSTLQKADFLADEALKLAKNMGWWDQPPVVLSYFQKALSIRVIPYANVLMLGIPYSTKTVKKDFLAIPHEVGHHVFWQGKNPKTGNKIGYDLLREPNLESEKIQWVYNWLEEMFADIYGAHVAGPFIALSFQDLQLDNSPPSFISDDQDHPTPNLRPYIYTKTLNKMGFGKSAALLNDLWDKRLADYITDKKEIPPQNNRGKARKFDRFYFKDGKDRPIKSRNGTLGTMKDGLELGTNEEVDIAIRNILLLFNEDESHKTINCGESRAHPDLDAWQKAAVDAECAMLSQPESFGSGNNINEGGIRGFLFDEQLNNLPTRLNNFENFDPDKISIDPVDLIRSWDSDYNPEVDSDNSSTNPCDPENSKRFNWFRVWLAGGWTTEGPKCNDSGSVC